MVVFNFPLVPFSTGKDDIPSLPHLRWSGAGDKPAIANATDPLGGGVGPPTNPYRRRWLLNRFRRDADPVAGEELAFMGNVFFLPEPAHQANGFIGALAAVFFGDAAGFILLRFLLAQSYRRKEAPSG